MARGFKKKKKNFKKVGISPSIGGERREAWERNFLLSVTRGKNSEKQGKWMMED